MLSKKQENGSQASPTQNQPSSKESSTPENLSLDNKPDTSLEEHRPNNFSSLDNCKEISSNLLQNDFSVKHPLQNRWTLSYLPGKSTSKDWASNLKPIFTFDTVEDFWRVYNNILPPSKLGSGSNYHLFKEHIEPTWEHVENSRGGKWIVRVQKRDQIDQFWLYSLLACIGESFGVDSCNVNSGIANETAPGSTNANSNINNDDNEICGVVVSVRSAGSDRISLWTKNAKNEVSQRRIGLKFKKFLEFPSKISYQLHEDALQRGSSFHNNSYYTV